MVLSICCQSMVLDRVARFARFRGIVRTKSFVSTAYLDVQNKSRVPRKGYTDSI